MSNKTNDLTNPVGSVQYTAFGGPNKVKTGTFSLDNPYFQQMKQVDENAGFFYTNTEWQDVSALYDRAIEWQADRANLLEQREYDKQVLEEQREYDSPEAQMLRMRQAGINPDLAGGSGSGSIGSGSGAQMAQHSIADQQGTTPFGNPYTDKQLLFEGLNTAVNFMTGLTSGVTSIMNSVSSMKMVPSQIKANEASSGLMDAQANELNTLLKGKKTAVDLANSTELLTQLAGLKDLFTLDTTDDEMSESLKGLGYTEDQVKAGVPIIKKFQQDPALHARYNRAQVDNRFAEQENQQYTTDLVAEYVDLAIKHEGEQKRLNFATTQLQRRIADYVNTDEFAQLSGQNVIDQEQLVSGNIGLQTEMLKNDTDAFFKALDAKVNTMDRIQKQMSDMVEYAKKQGRGLTPSERTIYDRLNAEYIDLYSMTSSEFYKIKDSFLSAMEQKYVNSYRLDEKGQPRNLVSLEAYTQLQDIAFNDYVQHNKTGAEYATMYVSCFSTALRDLMIGGAAVAGAAKGGVFPSMGSSGGYTKHGDIGFRK